MTDQLWFLFDQFNLFDAFFTSHQENKFVLLSSQVMPSLLFIFCYSFIFVCFSFCLRDDLVVKRSFVHKNGNFVFYIKHEKCPWLFLLNKIKLLIFVQHTFFLYDYKKICVKIFAPPLNRLILQKKITEGFQKLWQLKCITLKVFRNT